MQLTINISDFKVSRNPGDVLVTYALGSCIGVAVADPSAQVAGLLHFQLPDSAMDPERALRQPGMFADSGLDALIAGMLAVGAQKRRLRVKVAGGAKMLAGNETFDIGKRNHTAIRKALWSHSLLIDSEDCGGSVPRTMFVNVSDGRVMLKRKATSVAEPAQTDDQYDRVSGGIMLATSDRPRLDPTPADEFPPMRIGI